MFGSGCGGVFPVRGHYRWRRIREAALVCNVKLALLTSRRSRVGTPGLRQECEVVGRETPTSDRGMAWLGRAVQAHAGRRVVPVTTQAVRQQRCADFSLD